MRIILDPPADPERNMAADEELIRRVREGVSPPALRIYRWDRRAISIGRRQRLEELPDALRESGLPVVRRPTGGGAVVHSEEELTYALALPAPARARDLPRVIHRSLRELLVEEGILSREDLTVARSGFEGPFTLCFEAPVSGDLLFCGRKVGGAALRVWKDGALVQGSVQGLPVEEAVLREALIHAVRELFLADVAAEERVVS